jgi:adhesin/invasin
MTSATASICRSYDRGLSPKLNPGEMRVVLTWGYSPSDLDAHLYGPLPNGKQFHVSYDEKQAANVLLDVDDRESFGPETITVKKAIPGKYEYKIHAYQDPKEAKKDPEKAKRALARSSAEVKIYSYGNKEPSHYRVDPKAIGTVWNVASIEVTSSGEVSVKPYLKNNYSDDLPE